MAKIAVENPFVAGLPSAQHAVDIFAGEWASRFPASTGLRAGEVPLFEDPRIQWADRAMTELCGTGFAGQDILELGPLEGGQTYMFEQLGAKSVTAVEANARAFLKCLVAKEVMGIGRARFLLGDAIEYLRQTECEFDVGVAVAFLNHMLQPVEVIELLARRCRKLFLWNVVFDESVFVRQPDLRRTFGPPQSASHAGFAHTLYPHSYGEGFDYRTFWGGTKPACCWMRPDELVAALRHFGFAKLKTQEDDNPWGRSLAVVASKD